MSKDLKQLIAIQAKDKRELIQELIDNGSIHPRKRASKEDTKDAYGYVLDTGDNADTALKYVADKTNKSDQWIDEIKHSPLYKSVLDYVINSHKEHPVTLEMVDKGVMNKHTKRSLKTASSLNVLLNTLSHQVQLTKRVEDLETIAGVLIKNAMDTNTRLDILENKENIIESTKEKALHLLEDGYNISEVAEMLNKDRKTITRWRDE